MAIHMTEVKSSQIHSIGYDKASKKLQIQFKGNQVYLYDDVEHKHYLKMLTESAGQYFHAYIRGNYTFEKL